MLGVEGLSYLRVLRQEGSHHTHFHFEAGQGEATFFLASLLQLICIKDKAKFSRVHNKVTKMGWLESKKCNLIGEMEELKIELIRNNIFLQPACLPACLPSMFLQPLVSYFFLFLLFFLFPYSSYGEVKL